MKYLALPFLFAGALRAANPGVVPGMNAFTTAAYQQLDHGNANLILSPFNIGTALSMVLGGARDATADQIAAVLHQHYDSSYDAALAALLRDLAGAGNAGDNKLLTANALWGRQGLPLQSAFQKTLATSYQAPLTVLDFAGNPERARSQINRWAEQHTNDKIKDLLGPGSIDIHTQLVLTSAIYFYGKWQSPFLSSRTQPDKFFVLPDVTVPANFMHQTAQFGYAATASAQILEMRYAGTGIAFDVVLPKTNGGLADMEKSLTPAALTTWLASLSSRKVQVTFPKFRAESAFSLRETLSAMGMPLAFSNHADFSGICSPDRITISQVAHKAYVDVAEEGTEAAAATGITMQRAMAHAPEPVIDFRADHPFLFLIRDTSSGVILFIGRVMNPAD